MPPVRPQTPNGRTGPGVVTPRAGGSLLAQALDVGEMRDTYIKLTVYGQNRVGKTTLACTFPKPLMLLSFEPVKTGGAISVRNVPGVKILRFKYRQEEGDESGTLYGSGRALEVANELRHDSTFKTVVIDSATSYQDLILQELLGLDKLPEQLSFGGVSGDQYRARSEKIKEGLRPFLDLNKHVVVTAKEKDHNPPKEERVSASGKVQPDMRPRFLRGMQQESFVASDLGGAAVQWLHDACDLIGRLYLDKEVLVHRDTRKVAGKEVETETYEETGRIVHKLRTMYHPNFAAGFRAANPKAVPEFILEPDYEKIKAVVDGAQK